MTQRHQDLLRSISARPAHLDTGAGPQEVVSIVGRDVVFEHGLCAEPILGTLRPDATGSQRITPERFQENAAFVQYLRGLLAVHVYDLEGLQRAAQEQGDGYVYLIDARTPDPDGEVPPADIVLTEYGFFRLGPELEAILHNDVRTRCAQPR